MGTQVHLQLHTGRIPAEHFYFIGKGISYKVKKAFVPAHFCTKTKAIYFRVTTLLAKKRF